jgi:hypothetical protein
MFTAANDWFGRAREWRQTVEHGLVLWKKGVEEMLSEIELVSTYVAV